MAVHFSAVLFSLPIAAQETEVRVVDEVVAQVNDGVITLSRIKRELKAIIDQEVTQGKSREDAERFANEKKGELIASMINEELLLQRGKELKIDADVEATVNQRAVAIMKEYDLKTLDSLMLNGKAGVDPKIFAKHARQRPKKWLSQTSADCDGSLRPSKAYY